MNMTTVACGVVRTLEIHSQHRLSKSRMLPRKPLGQGPPAEILPATNLFPLLATMKSSSCDLMRRED